MAERQIQFYNRAKKTVQTETVLGDSQLRFAYGTLLGRSLWWLLFGKGLVSRLMGAYYDSPKSANKIPMLASIPGCNAEEAEKDWQEYASFNDFFARKLKSGARPFQAGSNDLCCPADGRVLVYPSLKTSDAIPVKGAAWSLNDLCMEFLPESRYAAVVVRLAPVDYHRYHFPFDCFQRFPPFAVPGKYHSVNPIALHRHPAVFVENTRQITELSSEVFGSCRFIEVGAFGVGSIIQSALPGNHGKMEEKGFFKFGGSTVILLIPADKIRLDDDLLHYSEQGMETLVCCGDTIGQARQ